VKAPTEKQFKRLRVLIGHIVLTPGYREWLPFVNRGWVEAAWDYKLEPIQKGRSKSWPPLRLTADGYRALADGIDKYGWPKETPIAASEGEVDRG